MANWFFGELVAFVKMTPGFSEKILWLAGLLLDNLLRLDAMKARDGLRVRRN
jgi:hypothetical protein